MPDWKPNKGPQEKALQRSEYEILYGGARGGGKTDAGLVKATDHVDNPRFRGLIIRKNAKDLSDWVDRAIRMYSGFKVTAGYQPPVFRFPSGAIIRTGHLRDDTAYTQYQGQEYQFILIEELTQIPNEKRYLQLTSSCRSTIPGIKAQIFCTTNPGGIGHGWVKKRFIDPSPPGKPFTDKTSGRWRIYIPAKIDDNPVLMENDPDYVRSLDALKDSDIELWKAWRMGDWDTFAGQYFREFRRDLHVLKPFTPRKDLFKLAGLDWGRADAFACLPSIVYPVKYIDPKTEIEYKFYRCITYQEAYGTEKSPAEWGEIISKKVNLDELTRIEADNQIWNTGNDMSTSIYDQFCNFDERYRPILRKASKDRVNGWENVHNWLSIAPDGKPYWMMTENCVNLIRTLPELVHDENIVEDVDTTGEDHAPDAVRYMLKSLKWIDAKLTAVRVTNKQELTPKIKSPLMGIDTTSFQ